MQLALLLAFCVCSSVALFSLQGVADPNAKCNDGTPYKFYIDFANSDPNRWVFFYQGGAWCFDAFSCNERYNQSRGLMSSSDYSSEIGHIGGILSDKVDNAFHSYTRVFLPYCTSDDFSGNAGPYDGMPYSFMGSHVTPAVIQTLQDNFGLRDSGVTLFVVAGASAGAEALFPNIDRIKHKFLPQSIVKGLCDSGYFMSSVPYYSHQCRDAGSCTEQEGIEKGVKAWNSILDDSCVASKSEEDAYLCLLGPTAAPYISTPTFYFQYLYDAAQLGHDGIGQMPTQGTALEYAHQSAANLTASISQERYYFLPACYHHTILGNGHSWPQLAINNSSVMELMLNFVAGDNTPVNLVDSCQSSVNCNPTCPPNNH